MSIMAAEKNRQTALEVVLDRDAIDAWLVFFYKVL